MDKEVAKPLQAADGFLLPHHRSFSAVFNHFSKTYRWTSDEATKHSQTNALAMRRDPFIMGCLRERGLAVVQTPWHIEPEDQKDEAQVEEAQFLANVVRRTPNFQKMLLNLHDATWYGRYASQVTTCPDTISGEDAVRIADHFPINGDKIQYTWNKVPCITVNPMVIGQLQSEGATVIQGERWPLLVLDKPYYRDRFIVHTHETDDADYFEGEMAGAVAGVGIRSRIYWAYWLRDEMLSWAINYMEKVGTLGILLFYYDPGSEASKTAAEEAAAASSTKTAFAVPRPIDKHGNAGQAIDHISSSTSGIEMLCGLIDGYFERHIERFIVGQTLSSKAESTGLGSSVADLHADTKYKIIKFDCDGLAESLTTDLVKPLQRLNRPDSKFYHRFVFDVPVPDADSRLNAAKTVVSMGGQVKESEVLAFAGLSKPDDDDEVLGGGPDEDDPDGPGGNDSRARSPKDDGEPSKLEADKHSGGRWITIGGSKGADGKRHGGSPVYIENGRITKGHPSLTGKKIGALKEDAEPSSHRKELNQSKSYARAVWGKKAKSEGYRADDLHQMAAEILAHDKEHVGSRTEMLKAAREMSERMGFGKLNRLKSHAGKGGDADSVKGFDVVAESMASSYPEQFIGHDDPFERFERLYDLLAEGNPTPMSEDEAYETAFEQMRNYPITPTIKHDDGDEVPF